jgi:Arc/MetJ family transcription regulator
MRTNIDLDERLLKRVMRGSGTRTKKAAVDVAMRTYVEMLDQQKALDRLWGAAKWEGNLEQSRLNRIEDWD